jgi:hypothetical protein
VRVPRETETSYVRPGGPSGVSSNRMSDTVWTASRFHLFPTFRAYAGYVACQVITASSAMAGKVASATPPQNGSGDSKKRERYP